jgi:WD40 repeat protein
MMDTPDNFYAILGVPIDADSETLKRAYRQLARRYHPDVAGPGEAVQMKRINRAYDVLSDPEKRQNYDTIIGGVIDFRKGGLVRPRSKPYKFDPTDDIEFSGLSIFSTKGPFQVGPVLRTTLGVISSLSSFQTQSGSCIATGTLDGKGMYWHPESAAAPTHFAADPALTVESLRALRFSARGNLLAGWGRLGLHIWDCSEGHLLWSYPLVERAVSAYYSLDTLVLETSAGQQEVMMALPLLPEDNFGPRALGVRATDVVKHMLGSPPRTLSEPLICAEEEVEKRHFWAIRLRALAQDTRTLLTLSCAHVPGEADEMAVIRRWDLTSRTRVGNKLRPQITTSVVIGRCIDYTPPYAVTPDAKTLAIVYSGRKVRLYDTVSGLYSELPGGTMGGSAKLALSPDGKWLAIAREDSEINEGVIDLWATDEGQIAQKLYHPWQISALHFSEKRLIVALTDGTIQIWQ